MPGLAVKEAGQLRSRGKFPGKIPETWQGLYPDAGKYYPKSKEGQGTTLMMTRWYRVSRGEP